MPPVVLLHDVVLELAQLRQVDARLAKLQSPGLRVTGLVDQLGDVQKRFRWNAAAIHAHAAGVHFGIDERGGKTEIGSQERSGVSAGSAAHNDDLG